jgi:hypothetical protein
VKAQAKKGVGWSENLISSRGITGGHADLYLLSQK